jgi:hypothetical protein
METWEKELRLHNLQKSIDVDLNFDTPVEIVKAEFSTDQREKLADKKEALPDGSFPIRNASDLHNAIHAVGRASDIGRAKAWIKRRAKELGKEGSLPEEWDTDAKVEKALEDELEKARSGVYANNAQNKKQARVGERYGAAVHGGQTHGVEEEGQLSEEDLKEHAKNASEQALASAIKTSPDPTVRQVAHAEMKRRQEEEKTGAGNSFPGKQSDEGEKKKPELHIQNQARVVHAKKLLDAEGIKFGQGKKEPEKEHAEANLGEKHKKELGDHQNKTLSAMQDRMNANKDILSRHEKERKAALDAAQGSEEGVKKLKEVNDRHTKEWKEHNDKHQAIEDKLKGEHKQLAEKHSEKKEPEKKPEEKKKELEKKEEIPFEKESKELQGKHDKEMSDHIHKLQEIHKKIGSGFLDEKKKVPGKEEHYNALQKQHEEGGKMITRHQKEKQDLFEKHNPKSDKKIEKSIQGIRYF